MSARECGKRLNSAGDPAWPGHGGKARVSAEHPWRAPYTFMNTMGTYLGAISHQWPGPARDHIGQREGDDGLSQPHHHIPPHYGQPSQSQHRQELNEQMQV